MFIDRKVLNHVINGADYFFQIHQTVLYIRYSLSYHTQISQLVIQSLYPINSKVSSGRNKCTINFQQYKSVFCLAIAFTEPKEYFLNLQMKKNETRPIGVKICFKIHDCKKKLILNLAVGLFFFCRKKTEEVIHKKKKSTNLKV